MRRPKRARRSSRSTPGDSRRSGGGPATRSWPAIRIAADRGAEHGLVVNAGHGLGFHNVSDIARIEPIRELNIGHAIIARAVFSGLDRAVRDMRSLMDAARASLR